MNTTVLAWLVTTNIAAFVCFYFDKRRAISGGWRIPEKTLLTLALLGGSLGAKLAQHRFRHKTRKQPFAAILNLIVLAHMCFAIAWTQPNLREHIKQVLISL